jgi:hypothetical protein
MIELRSDQREVAKRLVEVLKTHPVVGLQAPTGWGKTIVALEVIKELSVKALWLTPRLSIGVHVFHHCGALGLRCLATAGREKMCSFGYSSLDFARGVCHRCGLNQSRVSIGELDRLILGSLDFGKVKEAAEQLRICPYKLQTLIEGMGDYDVVIAHYNRARKLVNALRPRLIIADEVHNVALPIIHRVNTKELRFLLEKLGFEEDEALGLVRSPETLRALLQEMVDSLIYVIDEDGEARPIVEELVEMLGSSIWYYDESEDAVVGLEVPELPRTDAKMLLMSATLPPSLASDPNVITVRRGWAVPVRIDSKYVLTYENVRKRREEIGRYVAERYLRPSTVVFTTTAREDLLLLNNKDGIIWEDELEGRTPCDFKNETVVLRAYGRYAEGINLDCFGNLVLLGLPALQPTAMHRLEARGIKPRDLIITKLVQIIGRVTRSPTPPDKMPNIYLVDKRFRMYIDDLRNYEIQAIND